MPNVITDDRLCLDETSLDFRNLDASELERHLDQFADVLSSLHQRGLPVRVHPWLWEDVECFDDCSICDFVYQSDTSTVSRDTRVRLGVLLERCPTWDEGEPGFLESVSIAPASHDISAVGDRAPTHLDPAFSVGIALSRAARRMACLVFAGSDRSGWWCAPKRLGEREVFFFAREKELAGFWRSLYTRERIAERDFFTLAAYAFPDLILHSRLDFRHFTGHYRDLRDRVATILGVLNDQFARAFVANRGMPHEVQTAVGSHGVEISLESPTTRGSGRLIAQREVVWNGQTVRCEWHAKIEPHRNRIHFSEPMPDNRILVGIFVDHLDTMTNARR